VTIYQIWSYKAEKPISEYCQRKKGMKEPARVEALRNPANGGQKGRPYQSSEEERQGRYQRSRKELKPEALDENTREFMSNFGKKGTSPKKRRDVE